MNESSACSSSLVSRAPVCGKVGARLWQGRRETDGFFLRAESFYPLMTQVEAYEIDAPIPFREWGGQSPHERSHGEAFLTLLNLVFLLGGTIAMILTIGAPHRYW